MKPSIRLAWLAAALACSMTVQAQLKLTDRLALPDRAPPAAAAPEPTPAAASPDTELENAGKLAAHAWLTLLDRRDWGTAWDASGAAFRQSVPLGNWMDAAPQVRQTFGVFVEREAVEAVYKTSMPGRPEGQYVSVMFASKFDQQVVQEVVTTVREPDGRWRVIGYSPTPR